MVKELLQDDTILNDCMITLAEAVDMGQANEQIESLEKKLDQYRERLYELMKVKTDSVNAKRQIEEEIEKILRQSECVNAERNGLITSIERNSLDEMRMKEINAFIAENNPLDGFDKDLFRKLINYAVVHSRNEVEFFLYMGTSKRVRLD